MDGQTSTPGNPGYSLRLSETELTRYRLMAASAADHEDAE